MCESISDLMSTTWMRCTCTQFIKRHKPATFIFETHFFNFRPGTDECHYFVVGRKLFPIDRPRIRLISIDYEGPVCQSRGQLVVFHSNVMSSRCPLDLLMSSMMSLTPVYFCIHKAVFLSFHVMLSITLLLWSLLLWSLLLWSLLLWSLLLWSLLLWSLLLWSLLLWSLRLWSLLLWSLLLWSLLLWSLLLWSLLLWSLLLWSLLLWSHCIVFAYGCASW